MTIEILYNYKPNLFPDGSAVALGFFDGVHLGHREIIKHAVDFGQKNNLKSIVSTFINHPHAEITGQSPKLLTTFEDRVGLISTLKIDSILALEFNSKLRHMNAQDYFTKILHESLNAKFISIGYDHKFGFNQEGTPGKLIEWGKKFGIEIHVTPPININDEPVSSTRIRKNILAGKVKSASNLLGRFYSINGTVTQGLRRGTELGFPTANLMVQSDLITPSTGVYVGKCTLLKDLKQYPCVINIGTCPTFRDNNNEVKIETHLLNFETRNLYQEKISIDFIERLRDEVKFASKEELITQIKIDCENARKILHL